MWCLVRNVLSQLTRNWADALQRIGWMSYGEFVAVVCANFVCGMRIPRKSKILTSYAIGFGFLDYPKFRVKAEMLASDGSCR